MNLLFIPHGPLLPDIKTRGEEMAYLLSRKYKVFYLDWDVKYQGNIVSKIFFMAKQHFSQMKEKNYKNNFTIIKVPYSAVYSLKGIKKRQLSKFSLSYNRKILEKIIKEKNIDIIINQSMDMWDTSDLNVPYIYDIVDIPPSGEFSDFIITQAKNAASVTCISHYIKNALENFSIDSEIIPNGVDLQSFHSNVEKLKFNKYVIGYIGNHGWWSGLDFLLDVFREIQDENLLLIVGGGSEVPKAKEKIKREKIKNVILTGPIPKSDIIKYFHSINLGVLPFEKNILTDASVPIKVLEYTACKKLVLATDLEELKRLKLSNLTLNPRDKNKWISLIRELKDRKWDNSWNKEIETYDWQNLIKKMIKIIEEV